MILLLPFRSLSAVLKMHVLVLYVLRAMGPVINTAYRVIFTLRLGVMLAEKELAKAATPLTWPPKEHGSSAPLHSGPDALYTKDVTSGQPL